MRLYEIWDETAEQGSGVFEAKNDSVALRQFNRLTSESDFAPEFSLWCLGVYDNEKNPKQGSPMRTHLPVEVKPRIDSEDDNDE